MTWDKMIGSPKGMMIFGLLMAGFSLWEGLSLLFDPQPFGPSVPPNAFGLVMGPTILLGVPGGLGVAWMGYRRLKDPKQRQER